MLYTYNAVGGTNVATPKPYEFTGVPTDIIKQISVLGHYARIPYAFLWFGGVQIFLTVSIRAQTT